MALIINTADPSSWPTYPEAQHHIYNGLDSPLTLEIMGVLRQSLGHNSPFRWAYDFERRMQGPALTIMRRGIKVDMAARDFAVQKLKGRVIRLEYVLNRLAFVWWGNNLNPRSSHQLCLFFYDHLGLPEQFRRTKGKRSRSCDRDALETLRDYIHVRPICNAILSIREISKEIETLERGVDSDSRFRFSLNIAATETGRTSSSKNWKGTGGNIQNWKDDIRDIFVPDAGYKLGYFDYKQGESYIVAYEAEEERLIAALASGDLHTYCARLIWPHLPWSGDIKKDKTIALKAYYRHFSYRDISKRGGHSRNYMAKPWTLSHTLKISLYLATEFCEHYDKAFPGIPLWQQSTISELQRSKDDFGCHFLTTALGFRRHFFGRIWDEATWREAIAFRPQSTLGQMCQEGIYRLWKAELSGAPWQILANMHDAALLQFPVGHDDETVSAVSTLMTQPLQIKNRTMTIPVEASLGFNWRSYKKGGLLEEHSGPGSTAHQSRPTFVPVLDRPIF